MNVKRRIALLFLDFFLSFFFRGEMYPIGRIKKGRMVTAIINHVMLVNISTNAVDAVTSYVSTTRR